MILRPILQPILRPVLSKVGHIVHRLFPWSSLFADGTPGFRINIEEAIRLNQQALGPEMVSNGTFTDGTAGWAGQLGGTLSSAGGELVVTGDGVQLARASTAVATIPGRTYAFMATLRTGTAASGNVALLASNNANLTASIGFQDNGRPSANLRAATFFTASAATTYIGVGATAMASGTYFADNVSVREIDLSKCVAFQDSAGTLPVVSMEQPLGLILDTKLGVPMLGPELVTNGGFDIDSGWTLGTGWSIAGGVAVHTAGTQANIYATIPILTIGKTYRIRLDVSALVNTVTVFCGFGSSAVFSTAGTKEMTLTCSGDGILYVRSDGAAGAVTIDNISVREVPGVHFVQPSNTASRPVVSRRVNLLTAPKDFTSGSWTKNGSTTATQSTISFPNESQSVAQLVTTPAPQGASATFSVELSGTPGQTVTVGLARAGSGALEESRTTVTLTSEYQRYSATLTIANANQTGFIPYITRTAGQTALSVNARNADLRYSFDLTGVPPFQDVRSSTDYDEVGFPAYARADGLDDWLESGVVDMSSTDAVTVIAGVKKRSDGAGGAVLEFGSNSTTTAGTFGLFGPVSAGPNYNYRSSGSILNIGTAPTGYVAPVKNLIVARSSVSGDAVSIRINGSDAGSNNADQGTGNYTAQKFFLLRRAGTSLPFNGRFYGVTVIGKLLTDSQLAAAEQAERQMGRLY